LFYHRPVYIEATEKMARGSGCGREEMAPISLLRKQRREKSLLRKFSVILFSQKRVLVVFDKTQFPGFVETEF
jgi:hypothetical protein